jgi:UDPglucose 6-dehydrogenase
VNIRQKAVVFEKIRHYFGGALEGRTVALWGLAFKPNTDDMREAPSRALMEALWQAGARVRAYDPVAGDEARRLYGNRPDLEIVESSSDALQGADVLAIVTEWQEFRSPDFELIKGRLRHPVIFDGRNLYDPSFVKRFGLRYYAVGRGDSLATVEA